MKLGQTADSDEIGRGDSKPHLLLVDDEPTILSSLATVLSNSHPGCLIETAASAEEALQVFGRTRIDLLITDLKLPKMDGLSLARNALIHNPDTRSILMTAFGTNQIDYDAYQTGCVSYLEKPFDIDQLLRSIDETLDQMQLLREEPSASLIDALRNAEEHPGEWSVRVSEGQTSGLMLVRGEFVEYADFGGLVGITAIVRMLACHEPVVESTETAPKITHADLPVRLQAVIEAVKTPSPAQQIAILREDGRWLRDGKDLVYPSADVEPSLQRAMLAELIQRMRESRQEEVSGTGLKRKHLYFHQSLDQEQQTLHVQLRNLVNLGIDHFLKQRFDLARTCWMDALRLEPNCQPAKYNLELLIGEFSAPQPQQ